MGQTGSKCWRQRGRRHKAGREVKKEGRESRDGNRDGNDQKEDGQRRWKEGTGKANRKVAAA
eukprot:6189773-Pleurochrysis_carterae.AAC.5